jgi:photosystem II stability/assembly factor-like uncharacterized protein
MNSKLAIFTLLLSSATSWGQQRNSFTEVESAIESQHSKKELSTFRGWKHKHRWLDEFKRRVAPNGAFYSGDIFFREAEDVAKQKLSSNSKMAAWIPVGPTQPADASLTKGMGRINCITFHPTDQNTFWVGVAQGGVWKTSDGGANWTPLTDDLPVIRISDIAVDPNDTDVMYICVGDYAYMDVALDLDDRNRHSHYGIGVYKTTDGGLNWSPTGLTYQLEQLDGSLMRRVFIDPANSNNLVAAGVSGIWTSADAGASWSQASNELIWDIEADPNDANTLYASTGYLINQAIGNAGIMKSTDFGASWTPLTTGIPATLDVERVEIAVAPTNSNHVYALCSDQTGGFYGLYTSLDGGTTWNYSDAGGLNILHWYDGFGSGGQGSYDLSILVDPTDENTVYIGGVNIWCSYDGGLTFDGVSMWYDYGGFGTGLHADQHQFKYNPQDDFFYVCNDGGLVRTDTIIQGSMNDVFNTQGYQLPTQWEYMSDGMQTSSFYRLGLSEGNSGNFIAGAQDNSTYYNNGGNWSNMFGGDGMECALDPVDADYIYGSSQYGRILSSFDGGNSYNQMDGPSSEDAEWTTPFMLDPNDSYTIWAGFGNLYSASSGNDFTNASSNFADMPGAGFPAPVSHFNICSENTNAIYVAKRIYHSYNQLSEMWVTQDGGNNWTNMTAGLPDSLYFNYVEVDNDDELSAWVVTGGFEDGEHVYQTTDGGQNWVNITYDLPNLPANSIVHNDSSYYNTVYVGTDVGVYYINDTLTSWVLYNDNLPNVIVSELDIHYGDQDLYAATFGRGVWKTDLEAETSPNISVPEISLNVVNLEVYPNPNEGSFELLIEGYQGDNLALEVIDIMGGRVHSEELTGLNLNYSTSLNLNLANGMYFAKISAGKRMKTVRFVVR